MHQDYPKPVAALLSYGDPRDVSNPNDPHGWPDYVQMFGLCLDDLPYLIQMLNDPIVKQADVKSALVWTDVHAWRAIGQLGGVDAIETLIQCLDYEDEKNVSDWIMEEIPIVLGKIGGAAIEPLSQYLNDSTKGCWSTVAAAKGLGCVSKENPESRDKCIAALTHRLKQYVDNEHHLNGFLICELVKLQAVESLDVIRNAFQKNAVDVSIGGDLEDIEIRLGLRQKRSMPRPHYHSCGTPCHANHEEEEWKQAIGTPQIQRIPKVGRNDLCPCGSGKKYKKCCLAVL